MRPVFSIALLYALFSGVGAAQDSPCADADAIFRNAKIVTMSDAHPTEQAMAVRDGKILAIGGDAAIEHCASARTKIVNLQGQTVIPGLIDVHTHASTWATTILRKEIDATYPNVKSVADVVELVRERVASAKPGEWIIGSGWDDAKFTEHRYLTRQDLDAVSPENPVYLVHVSGHLSVANGAALKAAGISDSSISPEGGEVQRDSSGHLTGILKDTAMSLMGKVLPHDPPDMEMRAAKLVSERALALGLTTIHDIYLSADQMRGYQNAYQRGWLKLRVLMSPQIGSINDAEKLASMGVHSGFGDDHLKFGAAKMFADGGMGARTIAIYPPGVIGEPQNLGLLRWKPEDMQKAQMIAAKAGWQLETHAIGDRAIAEVLDSYDAVQKKLGLTDARFRIVHAGISTPAIQKRMKEIGIVVDGNPPFVYWIGSWFTKYGPERIRWAYPAKSYIDNDITEAAGSDCNVTPISPWWGIWSAVERKEMQTGKVLAPEERINIMQALKLYTVNGAYAGFEEKIKGSLEPGKLADFVVLDRDITTVPASQIKDTVVNQTYVGGERVFERSNQTVEAAKWETGRD
jgi:predicted amidohydrolase YtcJ